MRMDKPFFVPNASSTARAGYQPPREQTRAPLPQAAAEAEELLEQVIQQREAVIFTIGGHKESPEQDSPEMEEHRRFMRLVDESNRQIQEAIEKWKPYTPKPTTVPSALGLSVNAASGKLKGAELTVARVSQEYSDKVPAGHVISQVPAPGGYATKNSGVALVISKGPPPEQEPYDLHRRRERVPVLKIKSRQELEDWRRAHLRIGGLSPDTSPGHLSTPGYDSPGI